MSGAWVTVRELRQALHEYLGVRTGLARRDIGRYAAVIAGDRPINDTLRVDISLYEEVAFEMLRDHGDPATRSGPRPRFHVWKQVQPELFIAAENLLHEQIHLSGLEPPFTQGHRCILNDVSTDPKAIAALGSVDTVIFGSCLTDLDESGLLGRATLEGGAELREVASQLLAAYRDEKRLSPWSRVEQAWPAGGVRDLEELFGAGDGGTGATVFDQRFIDFLTANSSEVPGIHWRQFERLVAEKFRRDGYDVELGPGGNDDGVDIRAWPLDEDREKPPLLIIQCKRQKEDVGKVVVKALWADVQHERATRGLLVTSGRVSPGGASTISSRSYSVDIVDGVAVAEWLQSMRSPGTGPGL